MARVSDRPARQLLPAVLGRQRRSSTRRRRRPSALREKLRDIPPLHRWPRDLGARRPRQPRGRRRRARRRSCSSIRGELLKQVPDRGHLRAPRASGSAKPTAPIDTDAGARSSVAADAGAGGRAAARRRCGRRCTRRRSTRHLLLRLRPDRRRGAAAAPARTPTTTRAGSSSSRSGPGEPRFGLDIDRERRAQRLERPGLGRRAARRRARSYIARRRRHADVHARPPPARATRRSARSMHDDVAVAWSTGMSAADARLHPLPGAGAGRRPRRRDAEARGRMSRRFADAAGRARRSARAADRGRASGSRRGDARAAPPTPMQRCRASSEPTGARRAGIAPADEARCADDDGQPRGRRAASCTHGPRRPSRRSPIRATTPSCWTTARRSCCSRVRLETRFGACGAGAGELSCGCASTPTTARRHVRADARPRPRSRTRSATGAACGGRAAIEAQERAAWRDARRAATASGRAAWIVAQLHAAERGRQADEAAADDAGARHPDRDAAGRDRSRRRRRRTGRRSGSGRRRHGDGGARSRLCDRGRRRRARADADRGYAPVNLADPPPAPTARRGDDGRPPCSSRFRRRRRSPRAAVVEPAGAGSLLPDRFVLHRRPPTATPVIEALGAPIPSPLVVGPDPHAPADEQIRQENGELVVRDELRWLVDFDRAVDVGMGFRVDLPADAGGRGFRPAARRRPAAVGRRAARASGCSRSCSQHHRDGTRGLQLLPQGTPTNNTEDDRRRLHARRRPRRELRRPLHRGPACAPTRRPATASDGEWLAERAGHRPGDLRRASPGSRGTDQLEARAMNVALWPATLGYCLETMLHPVFDERRRRARRAGSSRAS